MPTDPEVIIADLKAQLVEQLKDMDDLYVTIDYQRSRIAELDKIVKTREEQISEWIERAAQSQREERTKAARIAELEAERDTWKDKAIQERANRLIERDGGLGNAMKIALSNAADQLAIELDGDDRL